MSENKQLIISIVFLIIIVVLVVYLSIQWYTMPCNELKTHVLFKWDYAPLRCI